jgi:hypothetical protein
MIFRQKNKRKDDKMVKACLRSTLEIEKTLKFNEADDYNAFPKTN